jgi:phage-related protein
VLNISSIAKAEKNKLHTDSAFIVLARIVPPVSTGVSEICIAHNNEDVTWNDKLYQAFPFGIGDSKSDNTGSEPSIEFKVSNVSRTLTYLLEQSGGGVGSTVYIYVVNTKALTGDPELEEQYTVGKTSVDENWVTFTLGAGYSLRTRRPFYRYMKNSCPFKYKGVRCACTSSEATCRHTLADCRSRGNSKRYGGFPGIDQKGLYLE